MRRWRHVIAIATTFAATTLAGAADAPSELRVATAFGGYPDVRVVEAGWQRAAPAWTRASRLDVTIGAINDARRARPFAAIAPVWSLARPGRNFFAEFSIGPAILGGSRVAGRELGGNFHFRSSLALGMTFRSRRPARLALRVSHISNGGIRESNPGLDYVGISFSFAYAGTTSGPRALAARQD